MIGTFFFCITPVSKSSIFPATLTDGRSKINVSSSNVLNLKVYS